MLRYYPLRYNAHRLWFQSGGFWELTPGATGGYRTVGTGHVSNIVCKFAMSAKVGFEVNCELWRRRTAPITA